MRKGSGRHRKCLLILSSPFACKGKVLDLYDKHYGDPGILVIHGANRDFNTSLPKTALVQRIQGKPSLKAEPDRAEKQGGRGGLRR